VLQFSLIWPDTIDEVTVYYHLSDISFMLFAFVLSIT
jgi:hypothetical protein